MACIGIKFTFSVVFVVVGERMWDFTRLYSFQSESFLTPLLRAPESFGGCLVYHVVVMSCNIVRCVVLFVETASIIHP